MSAGLNSGSAEPTPAPAVPATAKERKNGMSWGCFAFGVAVLALGWRDVRAGDGLGVIALAFTPLALALVMRRLPRRGIAAHDAEALAWEESGWGGPGAIGGTTVARPGNTLRAGWAGAAVAALAGCAGQQGANPLEGAIQGMSQAVGAAVSGKPTGATDAPPAGTVVGINGVLIAIDGPRPTDPRWSGSRIEDTPLRGFFAAHAATKPGQYFPRVAIRIDDYSDSLLVPMSNTRHLADPSGHGTPRPQECLKFDAVVWSSDKQRQDFQGLVLCTSDIHATDGVMTMGALRSYANLYAPVSISSAQARTMGPREPAKLLPNFTDADIQLYSNGQALFSALFTVLGYTGPVDGDQRLWFVNLAAKP